MTTKIIILSVFFIFCLIAITYLLSKQFKYEKLFNEKYLDWLEFTLPQTFEIEEAENLLFDFESFTNFIEKQEPLLLQEFNYGQAKKRFMKMGKSIIKAFSLMIEEANKNER